MTTATRSAASEIAAGLASDDRLQDLGLLIADLEALSLPPAAAQAVASMHRALDTLQRSAAALPAQLEQLA
jgi:hypothetical protein